jgi:hypothetical protein
MKKRLSGRLANLLNRPPYFWPSIVIAALLVILAIPLTTVGRIDLAGLSVSLAVFAIAAASLFVASPLPAKLWIERQDELNFDDVIFYLYDEPDFGKVPRDFLIQVHVAVANVGGRKAVLSALCIEALLDSNGKEVRIPGLALPLVAQRVQQGSGWRIMDNVIHKHLSQEYIVGPYVLEPDDVITMRLRTRPGIDWSDRWTLEKIRELWAALQQPIGGMSVTAIYRRGSRVERQPFIIKDLTVLQQELYVSQLQALTKDFQERPTVQEQAITDGL